MRRSGLWSRDAKAFSFEFFPPKTVEGKEKLRATWKELAKLKPRFFSCTFGAGGSTREGTLETVLEIRKAGHHAAPHLSCVASTREEIGEQLERYRSNGIRHIVALRGDMPSGVAASGEFRYANELVAFIRERTGDWFHIEVACYPEYHPQTRSARAKLWHRPGRRAANSPLRAPSSRPGWGDCSRARCSVGTASTAAASSSPSCWTTCCT